MTNSVQEKVKTDWEKAQKEGGQRIERIRDIIKAAAAETLSELKGGSSEIESMGRQSLAEMIAQLKAEETAEAAEAAEADTLVVEQLVDAPTEEAAETTEDMPPAPTWQEIFAEILHLVSDRKTDWAEDLLARLQKQVAQFDADMVADYGMRYRPFQPLVRALRSLLDLAHSRMAKSNSATPAEPLTIEVLDDVETPVDDSANVEGEA